MHEWETRSGPIGYDRMTMFSWVKKGGSPGWIGVDSSPEGMCGASVRMPGAEGGKPKVLKCGTISEPIFGAAALSRLARKIAVPRFQWTLPLERGDYKIVVLPEPAVKPAEMVDSLRWSLGALL